MDPGDSSCLSDPRFLPFREENFNAADFTGRILAGSQTTAQAKSEELQESVRIVDQELSFHIVSRHKDLLQHSKNLNDADHALQDVFMSVDSLKAAVRRVRAEIAVPYEQISSRTVQLRNLHAAINLIRSLTYRVKLVQKLKTQMDSQPSTIDLAKAAKLVTDIHSVDQEADFTGIEVVVFHNQYVQEAATSIREQAQVRQCHGSHFSWPVRERQAPGTTSTASVSLSCVCEAGTVDHTHRQRTDARGSCHACVLLHLCMVCLRLLPPVHLV